MKANIKKKQEELENVQKLINSYSTIGILDTANLPSAQLQSLRSKLKKHLLIRVTKKALIELALEKVQNANIKQLGAYLECYPALIFTNEKPFTLCKIVSKNKTTVSAKIGQIAPKDIIISKGPTQFAPGPVISEFGQAGIKTTVEGGKIAIKEDTTLLKKGELFTKEKANIATKLGIKPIEIGLKLVALYENGDIYTGNVLDINEQAYINNLGEANTHAKNLALFIAYPTKETVVSILQKAHLESQSINNLTGG